MNEQERRRSGLAGLVIIGLIGGAGLCACGRVGALEQPAPLYGAKANADYQARKAAAAAAKTTKDDDAPEPLPPEPQRPNAPR